MTENGVNNMKVMSNVLDRQFKLYQEEYEKKALEVLRSGWYVLGNEVKSFEEEFANYIGTNFCVGVASGLDALVLAFRALDIKDGDEVIVQANTYIASVMGITMNGATPIFVEPDQFYNIDSDKIEEKITERTKAILVVHLYGQATNMEKIHTICKKHDLFLVEDCAQSHGAKYNDAMTGNLSDIACWSFYPSKNLGAFGDAGALTTNNEKLADYMKVLRNYGSEKRYHNMVVGYNSRLDELQAGLLRVKLSHVDELLQDRERIAMRYLSEIKNDFIKLPKLNESCTHVWHLFVVECEYRDELITFLQENNIQALIHYPIPPHLSEAYKYLNIKEGSLPLTEYLSKHILTLPLYNGMLDDEIDYVIEVINKFKLEENTVC